MVDVRRMVYRDSWYRSLLVPFRSLFAEGRLALTARVGWANPLLLGIGHTFIDIGYSAGAFKLGGTRSIGHGHQVGWDASVYGGAGDSRVDDYVIEDCCTNCCRKALIQ